MTVQFTVLGSLSWRRVIMIGALLGVSLFLPGAKMTASTTIHRRARVRSLSTTGQETIFVCF